jgi:RNA polymerase sigma-70 factor, ECF subfamily
MPSTPLLAETTARIERDPGAAGDPDLVCAAQSGDTLAFIELCQRHSKRLLRRLQQITKNRQDAEDALQDALLSAYRNLHRFENRSAFSSWLTAIAINSALMTLRRRRGIPVPLDDSWELPEGWNSTGTRFRPASPERLCEQRERRLLLDKAIRRLPPLLRLVTELRVVKDLSIDEIALDLGISRCAVKSRLARARSYLRKSLVDVGLMPDADSALREPDLQFFPLRRSFDSGVMAGELNADA